MNTVSSDPTGRTAGQYARATVRRLRMRTLVTLGVLAVATALLGRIFGLHDARFLASEIALLVSMFVISRYVLPLVERHDRGRDGRGARGGPARGASGRASWQVMHDVTLGHGNVDHILIGPGRGVHGRDQEPSRAGAGGRGCTGRTLSQAQAQRKAIEQVTGVSVEPLIVFSRAWVDRPLARRKGVRVVPARMLLGYLQKRRPVLAQEQIEKARELLGRR